MKQITLLLIGLTLFTKLLMGQQPLTIDTNYQNPYFSDTMLISYSYYPKHFDFDLNYDGVNDIKFLVAYDVDMLGTLGYSKIKILNPNFRIIIDTTYYALYGQPNGTNPWTHTYEKTIIPQMFFQGDTLTYKMPNIDSTIFLFGYEKYFYTANPYGEYTYLIDTFSQVNCYIAFYELMGNNKMLHYMNIHQKGSNHLWIYSLSQQLWTGLNETADKESIHIYPNPAKDFIELNLSHTEKQNYELEIYSASGACVRKESISMQDGGRQRVSLHGLKQGVYTLRLVNEECVYMQKFIRM